MTKSDLQANIKNIILKLKLTSEVSSDVDLANILGTDKHTFSSWKNKSGIIPIEVLINFCNDYNVSLDWILRDEGTLKTQVSDKNIKIIYLKDIQDINNKEYVIFPKSALPRDLNFERMDVRAVNSFSDEMKITSPYKSMNFFDFNDKLATTSPNTFLFKAHENYFLRNISISPKGKYYLSAENDKIDDLLIDFEEIEIIAKLKGVIKWKK